MTGLRTTAFRLSAAACVAGSLLIHATEAGAQPSGSTEPSAPATEPAASASAAPSVTPPASPAAASAPNPSTPALSTQAAPASAVPAAALPAPALSASPAPLPAASPAPAVVPAAAPAVPPAPFRIEHAKLLSTSKVDNAGQVVNLYGIIGLDGEPARLLESNVQRGGGSITCAAHAGDAAFDCKMLNGTDLSLFALVNGLAQVRPDAPAVYQAQEADARDKRRGLWSSLPPPPITLRHPGLYDTATLIVNSTRYKLDGIEGAGGELASNMASYIQSKGDELTCQPQGTSGGFVCLLNDGTDIATVLLVNGAGRTTADAPDNYRLQEADAVRNRRGVWQSLPDDVIQATLRYDTQRPQEPDDEYGYYGPDPAELADADGGITYVGGQPTALIGAETVFLVYGDAIGWGYYDHDRRWHGAPDRFARHMERFHPEGRGLRAYPERAGFHPGGMHPGFGGRPGFERPGFERPGFERPGFGRPGFERPGAGRPGFERPGFERPGVGRPGFERPGFARPGLTRPEFSHPAFAGHPGFTPGPGFNHASAAGFNRPGMGPRPGMGGPGFQQASAGPGMHPSFAQPGRPAMPVGMGRPAMAAAPRMAAPAAPHIAAAAPGRHR